MRDRRHLRSPSTRTTGRHHPRGPFVGLRRGTSTPSPRGGASTSGRAGVDLRARIVAQSVQTRLLAPSAHPPQARHSQPKRSSPRSRPRLRASLIVIALIPLALAGTLLWALVGPTWQAKRLLIKGTSDPTLITAIRALPLTGCDIFRCDTTHAAHLVEELPLVAHATVTADYPDGLLVLVTPRHPVLLWQTARTGYVIADDGVVLGARNSDPSFAHLSLPTIADSTAAAFGVRAPHTGARITITTVEMAGQLLKGIPTAIGADWTLQYMNGVGFVATNRQRQQIRFGLPDDASQATQSDTRTATLTIATTPATVTQGVTTQLAEAHTLLAQLAANGQIPTLIDLRWGLHPYYRIGK